MHIYYLVPFFKANVNIFDFVDEVLFQSLQKKMKIIKFPIFFYKSKSLHNSNRYEYYCFRKKALYFKRGKKNQTAMKKQKLFCTLRWDNFLSEKDGNRV